MKANSETMLVQLKVKDLVEILKKEFPMLVEKDPKAAENPDKQPSEEGPTFTGRLLYGIYGIESFFNVSHKTAQQWKNTWLKPATKQNGRKIVADAAYAIVLFEKNGTEKAKAHMQKVYGNNYRKK